MKKEFNYQLNCNQKHDKYFFIRIKDGKAEVIIYGYNNGSQFLFSSFVLPFHPISSGWIDEHIFLLSEKELFYLNISTFEIVPLCLPKYKIVDILFLTQDQGYIYSSMIDPDFIEFYKKEADLSEVKIVSYRITDKEIIFHEFVSAVEHSVLLRYLKEYQLMCDRNICDVFEHHELRIDRTPLYSEIIMDDGHLETVFGCVDRAFFFGNKIIFSYSSLTSPTEVRILETDASIITQTIKVSSEEKPDAVSYCGEDEISAYHYSLHIGTKREGIVVLLHGGPAGRYSNRFEPMAYCFAKAGFTVYLLNYPGSTGYGYEYQKILYGNAGTIDCDKVIECLNILTKKYKQLPIYLVGDSYGAYLAILSLLKAGCEMITKVYALNAFTDIRHQYLFSVSRSTVLKYFPDIHSPVIRYINPIDLVREGQLRKRLLIINGSNDLYCPKEQILQFQNISGCDVILRQEYSHFSVDYTETEIVSDIILKDMGVR